MFSFDHSSAWNVTYYAKDHAVWEDVMENIADMIERLLEIQSGGRPRSRRLIAEDARLMDGLRKRSLAGTPTQTTKPSQDGLGRVSAADSANI